MLQTKRLGDLLTFQRGFDITKKEQKAGPIPIVSSSGIGSYHNVARVTGPGIVIGRKGTLGTVHYLREDFWPHDTTLWVREFKDATPEYLRYFLPSLQLKAFDVGASNPTLNRNHLHKLKVKASPPEDQSKIAAILTAYDDLIENNHQRIALLEKMAEEIYREWFVRLRFPGHEHTPVHKGVPEGWDRRPSSEILRIMSGGTPKTDNASFWGGRIPFFTPKDATNSFFVRHTEKAISEYGLESCNSALYPANTIFITARGTVGKIALAQRPMAMNQSCYALAPMTAEDSYYYFLALRGAVSVIRGIAKSGVFSNIIVDTFKQIPLFAPSEGIRKGFANIIDPIFGELALLGDQVELLQQTRDLLLNRLISGKVRLDELDIQFPPSMQTAAS